MTPKNLIPNIVDFELFLFQWSKKKATFVEFFSNKWSLTNSFDLEIAWTFQNNTTNLKISQLCPKCCALCFEKKSTIFVESLNSSKIVILIFKSLFQRGEGWLAFYLPSSQRRWQRETGDAMTILIFSWNFFHLKLIIASD